MKVRYSAKKRLWTYALTYGYNFLLVLLCLNSAIIYGSQTLQVDDLSDTESEDALDYSLFSKDEDKVFFLGLDDDQESSENSQSEENQTFSKPVIEPLPNVDGDESPSSSPHNPLPNPKVDRANIVKVPKVNPGGIDPIENEIDIESADSSELNITEPDDYVLKFKNDPNPKTIPEAIETGLIPLHLRDKDPDQIVEELKAKGKIEELMTLKDILVVMKSPENKAIPMLMSEIRRDGRIFNMDEIKHPDKIIKEKKGSVFDLRRIFIDIRSTSAPVKEKKISLSQALKHNIVPMEKVVDILLNKSRNGTQRIFGYYPDGRVAEIVGPGDARDFGSLVVPGMVKGLAIWTSPGSSSSAVTVNDETYMSTDFDWHTFSLFADQNYYDGDNNLSMGSYFFANAKGIEVGGDITTEHGSIIPWYGYSHDFHGFGITGKLNIDDVDQIKALSGGAFVAFGRNYMGIGVSGSLISDFGTFSGSLWMSRSKNRQVALSIPEKKYKKTSEYKVVVNDNKSSGLRVSLGMAEPTSGLGIGGRFGMSKGEQWTYKTYLSKRKALAYQRDGRIIGLKRLGKAFNTADLPDLENPLKWKVGDEVVRVKSDTYYGAVVMGFSQALALNVNIGVTEDVTSTYELRVKRLEDNKIEVTVNPTYIQEKGIFARIFDVAGVQASHAVAIALKQKFVFDLNFGKGVHDNFEAYTDYKRLIYDGRLPNLLSDDLNFIDGENNPGHLIEQLKLENKKLAARGIQRKSMEVIHIPHNRLAASAGLQYLGIKGFSVDRIRAEGVRIIASDKAAIRSQTEVIQRVTATPHSGEETKSAYATLNQIWENPAPAKYVYEFYSLVLTVEVEDTKVIGKENNEMRTELNKNFNLDFDKFKLPSGGESRKVILERKLSVDDLEKLRESPDVMRAKKYSGLGKEIDSFMGRIYNQGHGFISERVKKFVGKHGIYGIGAIHYLLGGDVRELKVRSTSSFYTDPVAAAEQYLIRWTDPDIVEIQPGEAFLRLKHNSSSKDINKFFRQGNRILSKITRGLKYLSDDVFYIQEDDPRPWPNGVRETKAPIKNLLLSAREQVLEIMDLKGQGFPISAMESIYGKVKDKYQVHEGKVLLLEKKYSNHLMAGDKRKKVIKRFRKTDELLEELESTRKEYNEDIYLPEEDREAMVKHYDELIADTNDIISYDQVKMPKDFDKLINEMSKKHYLFTSRKYEKQIEIKQRIVHAKDNYLDNKKLRLEEELRDIEKTRSILIEPDRSDEEP